MRRGRRLRRAMSAGLAGALVRASPAPASARKFQMSGTWLMRRGHWFLPLQFGGNAGGTQLTHASMGNWTEAPFFPTHTAMSGMSKLAQVVRDTGGVTAMGSAPATLRIPEHHWVQSQDQAIPLSGVFLIQIASMLQIDAPDAAA